MLQKIKSYLIMDCIIFTVMSVVLNAFYMVTGIAGEIHKSYTELTMEYFAASTTMAVLFFIADRFLVANDIKSHITAASIVVSTVFIEGGWGFGWFKVTSVMALIVLIIIVVIYTIVYFLIYAKNVDDSKRINKKLEIMQEKDYE